MSKAPHLEVPKETHGVEAESDLVELDNLTSESASSRDDVPTYSYDTIFNMCGSKKVGEMLSPERLDALIVTRFNMIRRQTRCRDPIFKQNFNCLAEVVAYLDLQIQEGLVALYARDVGLALRLFNSVMFAVGISKHLWLHVYTKGVENMRSESPSAIQTRANAGWTYQAACTWLAVCQSLAEHPQQEAAAWLRLLHVPVARELQLLWAKHVLMLVFKLGDFKTMCGVVDFIEQSTWKLKKSDQQIIDMVVTAMSKKCHMFTRAPAPVSTHYSRGYGPVDAYETPSPVAYTRNHKQTHASPFSHAYHHHTQPDFPYYFTTGACPSCHQFMFHVREQCACGCKVGVCMYSGEVVRKEELMYCTVCHVHIDESVVRNMAACVHSDPLKFPCLLCNAGRYEPTPSLSF
eukprot:Platyproteum_vivax@DN3238_c0_g1_i1.p1